MHVGRACRRKVQKTVYFQYSKSQKGHYSYKNWWEMTTLQLDLKYSKIKSCVKFQLNRSKHVREKCRILSISSIPSYKSGITLTKIDDTRTWSNVYKKKVTCKISGQQVKVYRRKVQKTVYFQYFKFQKWHNSYKNWRKLTTLKLDL